MPRRETAVFTDAEPAALELTERGTRIADASGVSDDARANAAGHHDEEQLMASYARSPSSTSFNRLNVLTEQRGGDYQPGQFR